ncbi:MAG: TonB-dependent receptor [Candidatus Kapaibacterium sp.]
MNKISSIILFISVHTFLIAQDSSKIIDNSEKTLSSSKYLESKDLYPNSNNNQNEITKNKEVGLVSSTKPEEYKNRIETTNKNSSIENLLSSKKLNPNDVKNFKDSSKVIEGKEVIISASKFEEPKSQITNQVISVNSIELEQSNSQTTADALSNLGNVFIQKSQGGGGSTILRGFEANKTLLVVDDVRMNNAIFRGGHLQNVLRVDNSSLNKLEVVFGPGSTVYGSDALGGVMHFRTISPLTGSSENYNLFGDAFLRFSSANNELTGHADLNIGFEKFASITSFTYSEFGDTKQGQNDKVMINVKDSTGKITKSYAAFDRNFYVERINNIDSIITNPSPEIQVGTKFNQYNLLQKFKYIQCDNIEHTLSFHLTNTSDVPRYDRLTDLSNSKLKFAEWYYGPEKWMMLNYRFDVSDKTFLYDNINTIIAYQNFEESRQSRRLNNKLLKSQIEKVNVYSGNVDAIKKYENHIIKYGLEVVYNDVKSSATNTDIVSNAVTAANTRYPDGGSNTSSYAVYFTDKLSLNDYIFLEAGARLNSNSLTAKFIDKTFFPFPYNEAVQNNISFSGNLGVIYSPNNNLRFSLLGSSGYRTPNVDDIAKVFESGSGSLIIPNPDLKSEKVYNGEFSIDANFSIFKLNTTAYYTTLNDAITVEPIKLNGQDSVSYDGTMSKVVTSVNKLKANIKGFSIGLNANFYDGFNFYGNVNLTQGRIESGDSTTPLDHVPPVYGNIGISYNANSFNAEFYYMFNGEKKLEDYKLDGEDNIEYATPEGMPAWSTLNFKSSYMLFKNIRIQAGIENILDKNYRTFGSGFSSPGRNIFVTLRTKF